jgi:Asp-tRNA(Asn)/Glu-tRNA(Gln) amidotransferase A subunit family amidase
VSHPQDLSLRDQAAAVASGELAATELLDATLARIAERDGALNSTPVTFPKDSHQMLADAPLGPLHGVPLTVKDMFALPWRGARNGTTVELFPPTASAPFRRLRDAGAVVVGVANMHELGMGTTGIVSAYGPTRNPWNVASCAGGSSGGSAAAVAGRIVAGSLGSDSGGSTRLPAAYCGVVGLKVTYRSLPYDGYFGVGTTFSAPGAFARDAADTRLLVEALLAGPAAMARLMAEAGSPPPALLNEIDDPWVGLPSGRLPADISNVRQASLANLCGVPAISVPVGLHPSGLPIGLQLLAPWSSEGRLFDAALHLEDATGRAHVERTPG